MPTDRVGQSQGSEQCSFCGGEGELEEGCSCYQCEYDDSAHRYIYPCPECQPEKYEAWERRGEAMNREAQAPLPASVSATREGSQRGRSGV